jgi:hypothetical protein
MTAARSVSDMPGQAAISTIVRPQPMQSAQTGSMTQILTQGVAGSEADIAVI